MKQVRNPVQLTNFKIFFYENCLIFQHIRRKIKVILSNYFYACLIEIENGLYEYVKELEYWFKAMEEMTGRTDYDVVFLNPCIDAFLFDFQRKSFN